MSSGELLDTAGAAELLGLAPTTLAQWRCQGKGPSYVKVGSRVRYRRADLDAWLESQTIS